MRLFSKFLIAAGMVATMAVVAAAGAFFLERFPFGRIMPQIVSQAPSPASTTNAESRLQVGFDHPVDPNSLLVEVVHTGSDGVPNPVSGALEIRESRKGFIFKPYGPFAAGRIDVAVSLGGEKAREWNFFVLDKTPVHKGSGGPILVIRSQSSTFGYYYSEILRAEGMNDFRLVYENDVPALNLRDYQVVIMAGVPSLETLDRLERWVHSGGKLIAVKPSPELARLAGLEIGNPTIDGGYLAVDTAQAPGAGLVSETIQFHGVASELVPAPATRVLATLADRPEARDWPALTVRSVGSSGGEIAAFAFDLAQSVVLTRQGNPKWTGQDRDGMYPIRPNDLFYGAASKDQRPDHVDLTRVAIPQADEKMRLLSNLINYLQRDRAPIPRFWYFPKDHKAVIVMTADDHGTADGTRKSFQRMQDMDRNGCDARLWECARATSWLFTTSKLTKKEASDFNASGFDLGSHVTTFCKNWSERSLDIAFSVDLLKFREIYPDLPMQEGSRLHCIAWSDYVTQALVGWRWGIRFDMNYYYWPKRWVDGRAGFMTGSGIPMRFSTAEGRLLNVYQQETHLVDEVFFEHPAAVEQLLKRAIGPEGYYGAFGTHYDFHNEFDVMLMDLAKKHRIPMVSARQMLEWLDGRSNSAIRGQQWNGETLSFALHADPRANGMLTTMLPAVTNGLDLVAVHRDGRPIDHRFETVKGVAYALFPGQGGDYRAIYRRSIAEVHGPQPTVSSR